MKLGKLQKYKKILIAGYGKEGHSTEQFLKKMVPNAQITVTDMSDGPDYLANQSAYDLVIKTPGIHKSLIKAPYTTATNIFFANVHNKIIGVTGTKGKSTTASLIYEILKTAGKKVSLLGNIGSPMLDKLLQPIDQEEIFVLELSSYQLDDIEHSPSISLVINLFPEHMNYHGSVQNYYAAKKNIIAYTDLDDYYVYNPRFPELVAWSKSTYCKAVPYIQELPFDTTGMKLIGEHNKENIRAAVTVGRILKVATEDMQRAVIGFQPLNHRLQPVGEYKGVTFYDDAISTTPESTVAAITSLKKVDTIFLGGQNRGYSFLELVSCLKEYAVASIVLFPESGEEIKKLLQNESSYLPTILETKDMKEAVEFAYKNTKSGKICLLSTASPSYSIWKNFEEKGDLFQKYVKDFGDK